MKSMFQYASALLVLSIALPSQVLAGYYTNCTRAPDPNLGEVAAQASAALCDKDYPFCVRTNTDAFGSPSADYGCVQCTTACDCGIGQYCVLGNTRLPNYGTCQSYTSKLGNTCNGLVSPSNAANKAYDTSVMCAVVSSIPANVNATSLLNITSWTGTCIRGVCRECNSFLTYENSGAVQLNDFGIFTNIYGNGAGVQNVQCVTTGISSNDNTLGSPRICKNFAWVESDATKIILSSGSMVMMVVLALSTMML